MDWLNYHHLLYFWTCVHEGGVTRAAEKLLVSQPTVSAQLRLLERAMGERLFVKSGRRLQLTETGQVVFRYADEIFALGKELTDTLRGRPTGRPMQLLVGVADVLPKMVVRRLLEPAFQLPEAVHVVCREDRTDRLLAEMSVHGLDLVLADAPVGPGVRVRAYSHLLGDSATSIVGTAALAAKYRPNFPKSLEGAPMILPPESVVLRRSLDQWFEQVGVRPTIVAECDDSALIKSFGQVGVGLFVVPQAVEAEVCLQYRVKPIGQITEVRERFYAISVERRIKHPAVLAISARAKETLGQCEE